MPRSRPAVIAVVTVAALIVCGVLTAAGVGGHRHRQHPKAAAHTHAVTAASVARAARSLGAPRPLPPLRRLTPPDAVVTLPAAATAHQLRRVRDLYGVHAVAVADAGDVHLGGRRLHVLGLALSARGFTPRFTAVSTPLWTSIARGELTVDFSLAGRMPNTLGTTLPAHGRDGVTPLRVGAFATVGLGHTDGLVDASRSAALGLHPHRVLLVAAPHRTTQGLRDDLQYVLGAGAHVQIVRPQEVDQAVISAYARSVVPAGYLRLYRAAAATCRGLPWTVLAAIGTVETGNGADTSTSNKGAMGPMQFLPSTFAEYAVDGDGDGVANIQDPADAIYSAARYLCAWGAGLGGQSLYAAIFAYNHADWYVREVLRFAVAYS